MSTWGESLCYTTSIAHVAFILPWIRSEAFHSFRFALCAPTSLQAVNSQHVMLFVELDIVTLQLFIDKMFAVKMGVSFCHYFLCSLLKYRWIFFSVFSSRNSVSRLMNCDKARIAPTTPYQSNVTLAIWKAPQQMTFTLLLCDISFGVGLLVAVCLLFYDQI